VPGVLPVLAMAQACTAVVDGGASSMEVFLRNA
jgi:hypothetical protein